MDDFPAPEGPLDAFAGSNREGNSADDRELHATLQVQGETLGDVTKLENERHGASWLQNRGGQPPGFPVGAKRMSCDVRLARIAVQSDTGEPPIHAIFEHAP
jgi:hypothetical protein